MCRVIRDYCVFDDRDIKCRVLRENRRIWIVMEDNVGMWKWRWLGHVGNALLNRIWSEGVHSPFSWAVKVDEFSGVVFHFELERGRRHSSKTRPGKRSQHRRRAMADREGKLAALEIVTRAFVTTMICRWIFLFFDTDSVQMIIIIYNIRFLDVFLNDTSTHGAGTHWR